MKHIDQLFCSSPASTAICSSMDPRAMVRPPPGVGRESKRSSRRIPIIPIDPKNIMTSNYNLNKKSPMKMKSSSSANSGDHHLITTTPTGSSRYLLNESNRHTFFDDLLLPHVHHDSDHHLKTIVVPKPDIIMKPSNSTDSPSLKSTPSSTPASTIPRTQVVELMVSIHCKGCEGKVRKHISKMEGVTSFKIDLDLKKVTVVGEVTPLQVLTSISRVKTAQFWPSSPSPNIMISSMSPKPGHLLE